MLQAAFTRVAGMMVAAQAAPSRRSLPNVPQFHFAHNRTPCIEISTFAQVLQAAFTRVAGMLAAAQAAPIQALAYPFADVTTALRQFSHARHVGKIVTRLPPAAEPPSGEQVMPISDPSGTM